MTKADVRHQVMQTAGGIYNFDAGAFETAWQSADRNWPGTGLLTAMRQGIVELEDFMNRYRFAVASRGRR